MEKHCIKCTNPFGRHIVNPITGRELDFYPTEKGLICEICRDIEMAGSLPPQEELSAEFFSFLDSQKEILFAYSGGLDSTVVLVKLASECRTRGITLKLFTLKSGVKGTIADRNVENVIDFLGLYDNHLSVDISSRIQDNKKVLEVAGKPLATVDVYKACWEKGILPCGRICNSMFDEVYDSIMSRLGFNLLITGGDTPKKNQSGRYSIFWKKPSGITIVRGACAFALTKAGNTRFVRENGIPWNNPECGGYDTDCLVPGAFFAKALSFKAEQPIEVVAEKYPIILDYLTERVRFGVIDYEDGLRAASLVDIASPSSYAELIEIFSNHFQKGD
ncbi:MAG: hypothetical protein WC523_01370 [Patescibacteria group bacterium]|jgi:predicted PP-loop superfamily ATPase